MRYKPTFTCPYCEKTLEATVFDNAFGGGIGSGSLGLCDCEESRKAADERSHLEYEARKRKRRKK